MALLTAERLLIPGRFLRHGQRTTIVLLAGYEYGVGAERWLPCRKPAGMVVRIVELASLFVIGWRERARDI